VVDERTRTSARDDRHAFQRANEDGAGILASDVPARENECPDLRRLQGEPLELAIADALVARENDPAVLPRLGEPDVVLGALVEMLGRALDLRAGFA